VKSSLNELLGGPETKPKVIETPNSRSLKDVVEADASNYLTRDEAVKVLQGVENAAVGYEPQSEFAALFDLEVTHQDSYDGLPSLAKPAVWLASAPRKYLADLEVDETYYDALGRDIPRLDMLMGTSGRIATTVDKQTRGFKSTFELPYACIRVEARRKQPNINSAFWYLVPLLSRTHLAVFSAYASCRPKGWNEEEPVLADVQWQTIELPLGDAGGVFDQVGRLADGFCDFALKPVRDRFGPILAPSKAALPTLGGRPD
jgi:hypothetical protein